MIGSTTYAPSTFEERGAAVAFTTPLLSQTRVRHGDRSRLEVLIPSFSDGQGIYVVPWRSVPEVVSMTAHDRFLHSLIGRNGAAAPDEVRNAVLRAARGGLAGPKSASAARAALSEDEEARTVTNFLLIVAVLRATGLDPRDLVRAGSRSRESEALTRGHMSSAAAALGIGAEELYRRVVDMADVVHPVGMPDAPKPGRVRRALADVAEFRDGVARWSRSDDSEVTHVAEFCVKVADDTHRLGTEALGEFDRRVGSLGDLLRDWKREIGSVRTVVTRLTWLVDGWGHIAARWRESEEEDPRARREVMGEIFRALPLIPKKEGARGHAETSAEVFNLRRRTVRGNEDWRTGRSDVELIRRIERVKARASEREAGAD